MKKLLLLLLIPLVSCGQNRTLDEEVKLLYRNTVPVISKVELDSLIAVDSTLVLLDCREVEEFTVSHLADAQLASYGSFKAEELKLNSKDYPVVVYCSIGYRSERIGEKLQDEGFTNVFNLYGGIFEWKNNGGVVVDSKTNITEKVHTYNKQWSKFLEVGEKVY
ncbi:MAG: rhodanese-related sulfurtransferase [Bacteroidia bacterium]|jgi:rhodanese-related sulfurtransferase